MKFCVGALPLFCNVIVSGLFGFAGSTIVGCGRVKSTMTGSPCNAVVEVALGNTAVAGTALAGTTLGGTAVTVAFVGGTTTVEVAEG